MITELFLSNFRNYSSLKIDFSTSVNVFIGKNGQGKTNLLEAIFFLGLLRSFRTSNVKELKKIGSNGFFLEAELNSNKKWSKKIEVEYLDKRRLKIDQVFISKASEFIGQIKVVVFSHDDILLITGNSTLRRRFINMFISTLNPEYLLSLQEYSTALRMRNSALRSFQSGKEDVVKSFEPILAKRGSVIVQYRKKILSILSHEIKKLLGEIAGKPLDFQIRYNVQRSIEYEEQYLNRFESERKKDFYRGYSTFGPHLDDFEFIYNTEQLRSYGSTGQCRLVSLCLKMAALNIFKTTGSGNADIIVLIDDVTGELEDQTKKSFYSVISRAEQAFFTFVEEKQSSDIFLKDACFYRVENGRIIRY